MKRILACLALATCLIATGCDGFERANFKTLSASKAVIDTAQADYEARTIPHNACSYAIINDAKGVQTVAVNALFAYDAVAKAGTDVSAQTVAVTTSLLQLAPLVVKVQGLISNPSTCGGSN